MAALTANASHSSGTNRPIGFNGMPGAKPIMRRSMAIPPPARNAMPILCSVTMVGNAQMQSEPRTHWLSSLLSIQENRGSTSHLLFSTSHLVFSSQEKGWKRSTLHPFWLKREAAVATSCLAVGPHQDTVPWSARPSGPIPMDSVAYLCRKQRPQQGHNYRTANGSALRRSSPVLLSGSRSQ